MLDNIKLLLRLFSRPAAAMSAILDEGSLLFASIAVLAVSLLMPHWLPFSFYTPLLLLAVVYVPGAVMLAMLLGRLGAFWTVFERDYSPLLTCSAMAWAASQLPLALGGRWIPPQAIPVAAGLSYLYFAVLMFFALRPVFGAENGISAGVVLLSWIPLAGAIFFWGPISSVAGYLASPFFLFYAYRYLGGEFAGLGDGMRSRQNFHRMLEAAAINPHDAEARYQLGLIYQQRHQLSEAIRQFESAVKIDPNEIDANFQLGRIALQQGRIKDAFPYLQKVLDQNEKHCSSEILRELGLMYLLNKQYEDARRELAMYLERRAYDPEGLYYYGQTLERLGQPEQAREMYARAVEAARATPRFRRRYTAKWSRLAQKQLARKL